MSGAYEFLEHTADIGIRARGSSVDAVFVAAAEGLAELLGAWMPGEGRERRVELEAPDVGALLVAWLDELLYLHEAGDLVFGGFQASVDEASRLSGKVRVAPRGERELESPGVKAATYHRLRVEEREDGWMAEVYLDV